MATRGKSIRSIQFRTKADVMAAFEARAVANWSLWQGDQFMFKYDSDDNLEDSKKVLSATLQRLINSKCAYCLRVYEDLGDNEKIKDSTPDDGSFNFLLGEYEPAETGSYRSELESLRAEVRQLRDGSADTDAGSDDRLGYIRDVLNLPGVGEALPLLINKLFGAKAAAVVNGVSTVIKQQGEESAEDIALNESIDKLLAVPGMDQALIKLSKIAETDPAKVARLIPMMQML